MQFLAHQTPHLGTVRACIPVVLRELQKPLSPTPGCALQSLPSPGRRPPLPAQPRASRSLLPGDCSQVGQHLGHALLGHLVEASVVGEGDNPSLVLPPSPCKTHRDAPARLLRRHSKPRAAAGSEPTLPLPEGFSSPQQQNAAPAASEPSTAHRNKPVSTRHALYLLGVLYTGQQRKQKYKGKQTCWSEPTEIHLTAECLLSIECWELGIFYSVARDRNLICSFKLPPCFINNISSGTGHYLMGNSPCEVSL